MTVFEKSKGLTDARTHYCPGCMHGTSQRIIAECLEELNVLDRTVGIASVGCSVLAYKYFNCDMQQAAHGRAPALATGIKRAVPDSVVFTLQGDGDFRSKECFSCNRYCRDSTCRCKRRKYYSNILE